MGQDTTQMDKGPVWFISQRYILSYMLSMGVMITFLLRFNFGVAIVCMVNHTALALERTAGGGQHGLYNHLPDHNATRIGLENVSMRDVQEAPDAMEDYLSFSNDTCGTVHVSQEDKEDGPFVWEKQIQGILLGAVFWTYALTIVPANHMLRRMSRKRLVIISNTMTSLLSFLMHPASLLSPWAVLVIKLAQGISSPLSFVSIYGMWTDWAPPQERAGLLAIGFSGVVISNVVVFPTSAMLCKYGFLGGWPSIFYVFGMVGIAWTLLFMLMTSDSPASHPWISDQERLYIQSSLAGRSKDTSTVVPWKSLLTSPAVWAMFLCQFASGWGLFLFLGTLPQYMKEVLKFDIRGNGLYSMFPFMSMLVVSLLSGQAADWLYRRKILRVIVIRKTFAFIANIVPAIFLCILSFLDCSHQSLAVGILTLAIGVSGMSYSVFPVNPYEITPRLAQPIIACSNCMSCISGITAPYLVGALTKNGSRGEWQVIMFFSAGVYVFGTVIFILFGQAEVQEWAKPAVKDILLIGRDEEGSGAKDLPLIGQGEEGVESRISL